MASRPRSPRLFPAVLLVTLTACAAPSPGPTPTATASPTATPTPTLIPIDAFMQGVVYPSYAPGYYSHSGSDWILAELVKPTGANWVNLQTACYQVSYTSTQVFCSSMPNSPTEKDFAHAVEVAHGLGMRVLMERGIWLLDDPDHWMGDIGKGFDEAGWQAWFESYTRAIVGQAKLAERIGVDYFSIGAELNYTAQREQEWRAVAAAVRDVYSGPILYSADDSPGGVENWLDIPWWDAVDAIGIHPYGLKLSASSDPSVHYRTVSGSSANELGIG